MQLTAYRAFTETLLERLARNPQVIGLVALGSMAEQDYEPDRWSDHDFFVVTVPGVQERFRSDMAWLPDADQIAFWFRETAHGIKVIYASGHLLEFAVFDVEELNLARVNRYRVLLDREQIEQRLAGLAAGTAAEAGNDQPGDDYLLGMFLANLITGAGRYWRGERLSGQRFVKSHAMGHLLRLLARRVPAARPDLLDNLDLTRRFGFVYPDLSADLDSAANLPPPQAALALLELAENALLPVMPDSAGQQIMVVRRFLEEATAGDNGNPG